MSKYLGQPSGLRRHTNSMWRRIGVLTVFTVCAFGQTSRADTVTLPTTLFGSAVFGGNDNTGCLGSVQGTFLTGGNCFTSYSGVPGLSALGLLDDTGTRSSASATANLGLGYVSASASGETGPTPASAYAHALIWDTLTFSGAAPGAKVTITMAGNATLSDDARIAATVILLPESGGVGADPFSLLEGNYFELLQGPGADPVTAVPSYSFQETFVITNGAPMFLGIDVQAFAGVSGCDPGCNHAGSATIDDPFSLELPTGVTFTSASGDLLSSVPEPGTWAMMLLGFGGIGLMLRGARRKQLGATTSA